MKKIIEPRREGYIKSIVSDASKFNNHFSWTSKFIDLRYILKSSLEWQRHLNEHK